MRRKVGLGLLAVAVVVGGAGWGIENCLVTTSEGKFYGECNKKDPGGRVSLQIESTDNAFILGLAKTRKMTEGWFGIDNAVIISEKNPPHAEVGITTAEGNTVTYKRPVGEQNWRWIVRLPGFVK